MVLALSCQGIAALENAEGKGWMDGRWQNRTSMQAPQQGVLFRPGVGHSRPRGGRPSGSTALRFPAHKLS